MGKERIKEKMRDYRKRHCECYVQNGILYNGYGQRVVYGERPKVSKFRDLISKSAFADLLMKRLYNAHGKEASYDKLTDSFDVYFGEELTHHTDLSSLYNRFLYGASIEQLAGRL